MDFFSTNKKRDDHPNQRDHRHEDPDTGNGESAVFNDHRQKRGQHTGDQTADDPQQDHPRRQKSMVPPTPPDRKRRECLTKRQ